MTEIRKAEEIELNPQRIVAESKVVTWPELGVALVLALSGGIPLFLFWFYLSHEQVFQIQEFALLILLGIYVFVVVETFAIFLLWGLQRLVLPQATIHWLGSATLGELSTLLLIAYRYAFHSK